MVYIKPNFYRFETISEDTIDIQIDVETKGIDPAKAKLSDLQKQSEQLGNELGRVASVTSNAMQKFKELSSSKSFKTPKGLADLSKTLAKSGKGAMNNLKDMFANDELSSSLKSRYQKMMVDESANKGIIDNPNGSKQYAQSAKASISWMKLEEDAINSLKKATDSQIASIQKENDAYIQQSRLGYEGLSAWEKVARAKATAATVANGDKDLEAKVYKEELVWLSENAKAKSEKIITDQKEAQAIQASTLKHQMFVEAVRQMHAEQEKAAKATNTQITALDKLKSAIRSVTSASTSISSGFKGMVNHVKSAAVTFRIIFGTLKGIIGTFADMYDRAASYQEALNLYTVALGKYADEGSKWAKKISTALYLDPTNIMQYTGALYNLVQGLGVASDDAYKMATNLTQLSYDMSSYLNIDPEAAYEKLRSAMTGQSRAVSTAGIALQQASIQQLAYTLGIKKSVSEMTQAEKTYLRYIQIMRSTTNMQGDLARTIITPENALRVVKNQFNLLAREIGNVFIPIVMKAIPYVMALTQTLKELAQWLASKLGFKIADIDYSSLDDADTALEMFADNADKSSKSARSSINRTLAAFDDLNVVESKSNGAGSGGSSDSTLSDLKKYVDGYDMLKGYTDKFSSQIEQAKKNLEGFFGVAKKVFALFLLFKGLQLADKLIRFSDGLKLAYQNGQGLPGLMKSVADSFMNGWNYMSALSGGSSTFFENFTAGCRNILGPLGKVVAGFTNITTSFLGSMGIMSSWNGTLGDLGIKLGETTVLVGSLTTASYLFISTGAAIATGAVGIAGAFIGLSAALEDYYNSLTYQERYDTLFDGMGTSIEALTTNFENGVDKITAYTGEIETLSTHVDDADTSVETAYDNVQKLHDLIKLGDLDDKESIINQLKESTDEYKDSIEKSKEAHIEYHNKVIENLKTQGVINESTYKQMKADAEKYYTWLALSQSEYATELEKLDAKLASGKITQDEYNKELGKLNDKYLGIIEPIDDVTASLDTMYYTFSQKIDLKNPQTLEDCVTRLKTKYDEGKTSLETQRKVATDTYLEEKAQTEELLAPLQKLIDNNITLSTEQQKTYDEQKKHLEDLKTEYDGTISSIETQSESLGTTYKDYLATIYGQISEAGMLGEDSVKGSVNTIKEEMAGLADFDVSNATNKLFTNLTNGMVKDGKTFETGTVQQFKDWGIKFSDGYDTALQSGFEKSRQNTEKTLEKNMEKYKDKLVVGGNKAGTEGGKSITEGESKGIEDNTYKVENSVTKMNNSVENAGRKSLEINSPSHVFQRQGESIVEGLEKGIDDNTGRVTNAVSRLARAASDAMKGTSLSLNIDTNIEGSFNSILSKLQTFCGKWRSAINDLMKNMSTSMNGITVRDGKISYSKMPTVSVSKFEQGGPVPSGDLFFANENGRAEFIANIGNRTQVVNQDQMIQAVSDAIIAGFSQFNIGNQKGDTYIYLGNDTLYKGQGRYQSRQTDRYGTSVINV